jgi:hypothetical protein
LSRELSAVRELSKTLDRSRENGQKELTALTIETERLHKLTERLENDRASISNELKSEVFFSQSNFQVIKIFLIEIEI